MRGVLEAAVALSVPGNEVRYGIPDRGGRWSPDLAAVLVAQIKHFARAIRDGIVRPGRQLVLVTVLRPGESASLGRDLKAKSGIGDNIDPRSGGGLPRTQTRHVFAPVGCESSKSVEEFQIIWHGRARGLRQAGGATDSFGAVSRVRSAGPDDRRLFVHSG